MPLQANSDPFGKAAEHAALAIRKLQESGVPPSLESFSVWYCYYSGSEPELVAEIDRTPEDQRRGDSVYFAELFERHIAGGGARDELVEANQRMRSALEEVVGALAGAAAESGAYSVKLRELAPLLEEETSLGELQTVIGDIVQETRRIADHNAALGDQLDQTMGQLQRLQDDLEAAQAEAVTDGLTGLANRKRFDRTLAEALGAAEGAGTAAGNGAAAATCLAMLDIDHFKRFNDTYGHTMGDEVLRLVAGVLSQSLGGVGLAARYGGEEFALVVSKTSLAQTMDLVEMVRATVASRSIVRRRTGQRLTNITLSAGVAEARPGETQAALIERADRALYAAKEAGRNRVLPAE